MSKDQPKNQSKIKSKVRELAEKQHIKSSYGLQKYLNVAPTVAVNLWNDDVTRFSVETLELLCKMFFCDVGDILVYAPNARRSKPAPAPESVKGESVKVEAEKPVEVKKSDVDEEWFKKKMGWNNSALELAQMSSDNETLLSTADVAQRLGINERTVRDNYNNGKLPFVKRGTKNLVRESDFIVFRDSRNSA
jgi:excisionase family DNA binding protein